MNDYWLYESEIFDQRLFLTAFYGYQGWINYGIAKVIFSLNNQSSPKFLLRIYFTFSWTNIMVKVNAVQSENSHILFVRSS